MGKNIILFLELNSERDWIIIKNVLIDFFRFILSVFTFFSNKIYLITEP